METSYTQNEGKIKTESGYMYLNRGMCKALGLQTAAIFALLLARQVDGFTPSETCNTGGQVIEFEEAGYFPYSQVDLARERGVSVSTIRRHLKKLIAECLIYEIKRRGEPCFYHIAFCKEWEIWLNKQRNAEPKLYLMKGGRK